MLPDEFKRALEREVEMAKSRRETYEKLLDEAKTLEENAIAELKKLAGDAVQRRPRGGKAAPETRSGGDAAEA